MNVPLTIVGVVYASLFLNFFLVASFDNLGPRLTESHGLDPEQLSIIISVKSFVNMAMGPALALLSSHIPLLFMFTACSFSIALAYTGIAFSSSMAAFLVSRALHGIGTSGLMVGGMSVLMRCVSREQRGRYSSIAYSAAGHAALVAPILSGVMYDFLGQEWTFLIPAILTVAVTVVSFLVLRRALSIPVLHHTESQITTINKSDMWPCVKLIFANPFSFIALAGIFSQGFSFGTCESTLPQMLNDWDNSSLPVLTTSLIYSVGPLTFTLLAPLVGFMIDRVGHYKVLLFALCMYTVCFPFFHMLEVTLPGLGACIGIAFGITVIAEVSVFPLIAEIVEATKIANADAIGYALNEMFVQGGYATGNVVGRQLVDWGGLLGMGVFIASWNAVVVGISLVILLRMTRVRLLPPIGKYTKEQVVKDTLP